MSVYLLNRNYSNIMEQSSKQQNVEDTPMQSEQIDTTTQSTVQAVADPNELEIEVKYFDLGEGYVCTQMSTQMTGEAFQNLT